MTICKLSGLACDCQPDEGVPCSMQGDGLKNLMLSWRAEAIRLQALTTLPAAPATRLSKDAAEPSDEVLKAMHVAYWGTETSNHWHQNSRPLWLKAFNASRAALTTQPQSEPATYAALLEFYRASTNMVSTIGAEEATAADEHAAEDRYDAAREAVRAALATPTAPTEPT